MNSIRSDDLDMDAVIKAIRDEPVRITRLQDEVSNKNQEIRKLKDKIASLEARNKYLSRELDDSWTMDAYQAAAMETARFGPVGHPSVMHFMKCFAAMGVIAERAKKAFRDNRGEFPEASKDAVWESFETIREQAPNAIVDMNKTCTDEGHIFVYPVFGLMGEAGEVVSKILAFIESGREDLTYEETEDLLKEVGDCMWYIAGLAELLNHNLSDVAALNIRKLRDRRDRNMIHGEGDNR